MSDATHEHVNVLGMDLVRWTYEQCIADVAEGSDWATIYVVVSENPGHGEATECLRQVKAHYEQIGKTVGGSVALNPAMRRVYEKSGITEYNEDYFARYPAAADRTEGRG